MRLRRVLRLLEGRSFPVLVVIAWCALVASAAVPNLSSIDDATGAVGTYNLAGAIDTSNPFFQSLGTNGRSCATCHLARDGMGLSSASTQAIFTSTGGHDPLFADVDGANCRGAQTGDRSTHSLLLDHGLIRVPLPMPANAQFRIDAVYDPYGCADTTDPATGERMLSVYRRPLPSTNLAFLSAVMFDGRETVAPLNTPSTFQTNLMTNLRHQAIDATLGHAEAAAAPTPQQVSAIVQFELSLFTAQTRDNLAAVLNAQGASGGPVQLSAQRYYPGINDTLGGDPTGAAFNKQAFTIFAPWTDLSSSSNSPYKAAREQIAAGQAIFNTFPLTITKVAGLNDALNIPSIAGTCTTCHDTPNVGNHSLPLPLDIGTGHSPVYESDSTIDGALSQLTFPDLPVYKVTCTSVKPPRSQFTTDPGRALISGQCADINRLKGPILRSLSARAPYFHNGAAATLQEVVNFYDLRFNMKLSDQQKQQLVAFLQSL